MLKKIRLIIGIIVGILILFSIIISVIGLINKEDPNELNAIPSLSNQNKQVLKMEIETQSLPMPGINE